MRLTNICADIPSDLRHADDLLHLYGRWAKDRLRLHRCGSAEREYRAPQDDKDREPKPVLMHIDLAMACQRSLAKVPEQERIVLTLLYVPQRFPVELMLRRKRIPPRLVQERHILGLRMFANRMKAVTLRSPETISVHRVAYRQARASLEQMA